MFKDIIEKVKKVFQPRVYQSVVYTKTVNGVSRDITPEEIKDFDKCFLDQTNLWDEFDKTMDKMNKDIEEMTGNINDYVRKGKHDKKNST